MLFLRGEGLKCHELPHFWVKQESVVKANIKYMCPEREQPPQSGAMCTIRFNNNNVLSAVGKVVSPTGNANIR